MFSNVAGPSIHFVLREQHSWDYCPRSPPLSPLPCVLACACVGRRLSRGASSLFSLSGHEGLSQPLLLFLLELYGAVGGGNAREIFQGVFGTSLKTPWGIGRASGVLRTFSAAYPMGNCPGICARLPCKSQVVHICLVHFCGTFAPRIFLVVSTALPWVECKSR